MRRKMAYSFLVFASFLFYLAVIDTPRIRLAISLLLNINVLEFDWLIVGGYIHIPIICLFMLSTIMAIPFVSKDIGRLVKRINCRVYSFFQAKPIRIISKTVFGLWIAVFVLFVGISIRTFYLEYKYGVAWKFREIMTYKEQREMEYKDAFEKYEEVFMEITQLENKLEELK